MIHTKTGLKLQITAIHENKKIQLWSIINVAKIKLEDEIWKYLFKMFMKLINEIDCEECGKNFTKFSKWNMNFVMILLSMLVITLLGKNSWGLSTLQNYILGKFFDQRFYSRHISSWLNYSGEFIVWRFYSSRNNRTP